jgi:hypothetical protein
MVVVSYPLSRAVAAIIAAPLRQAPQRGAAACAVVEVEGPVGSPCGGGGSCAICWLAVPGMGRNCVLSMVPAAMRASTLRRVAMRGTEEPTIRTKY